MTLLLIRHAETDLAGRFCGHANPPINAKGHAQIEELLQALEGEHIDAIYTSDLARAHTTANAIGEAFHGTPILTPALREIAFGEWEAMSWAEIESRDLEYAQRWTAEFPRLPALGGERFEDFQTRVRNCVEKLDARHEKKLAAVVTHAGVMRVVLRSLCGVEEPQAWERTRSYCAFFRCEAGKLV